MQEKFYFFNSIYSESVLLKNEELYAESATARYLSVNRPQLSALAMADSSHQTSRPSHKARCFVILIPPLVLRHSGQHDDFTLENVMWFVKRWMVELASSIIQCFSLILLLFFAKIVLLSRFSKDA